MGNHHASIETLLAETAWVRALAARLCGSGEEPEDVVQETWVAALRRPPVAGQPVRPWLATVVRNALAQRRRGAGTRRAREEDRVRAEGGTPAPEEWLERLELQELVSSLVRELPDAEREVVLLRYHEGLSSREVGARLGVPEGTVRWRAKRALDALRERLDRRFEGDRATWMAALAPLARRDVPAGTSALAGFGAFGHAAVALQAAAVVALLGGALWWIAQRPNDGAVDAPGVAVAGADAKADADEPFAAQSAARAARVDASRAERKPVAGVVGDDPFAGRPWTRLWLRVVDPTGAPVAGARVEAQPGAEAARLIQDVLAGLPPARMLAETRGHFAETDGSGRAELASRLLAGVASVDIEVIGPRFGRASEELLLAPGDEVDLGEVVLAPRGRVRCALFDARGEPGAGSLVLAPEPDGSETLDAAAAARSGPVRRVDSGIAEDGVATLHATAEGTYRAWSKDEVVNAWSWSEPFELTLGRSVEVEVRRTVAPRLEPIVLRVVGPDGAPRPYGIRVTSPGSASMEHHEVRGDMALQPSMFRPGASIDVEVRDLALECRTFRRRLEEPSGLVLVELEAAPMVERRLLVTGVGEAELAAYRLLVHADRWYRHVGSDELAGGCIRLPAEESVDLTVRADEHVPRELRGVDVAATPDPWRIELAVLPGITGRVTRDGKPVPAASLRASHRCDPGDWEERLGGLSQVRWDSGWSAEADADGRFRLPLQHAGDWILRVGAPGCADTLVDLSRFDPAVGATDLAVELVAPGTVRGVALDAGGAPRRRARVALAHGLHAARITRTDREGRFEVEGLPSGEWAAYVPADGSTGSATAVVTLGEDWKLPRNCVVHAGEVTHVTLREDPPLPLRGRISRQGGDDSAALRVRWIRVDRDPFLPMIGEPVEVAADGTFEIAVPFAKRYVLAVDGAGLAAFARWTVDVDTTTPPLELELPLARVSGRVSGGARESIRLAREGQPEFAKHVALDGEGAFGPLVVPAGELAITLPTSARGQELAARHPSTVPVTLAAGEDRVLDL